MNPPACFHVRYTSGFCKMILLSEEFLCAYSLVNLEFMFCVQDVSTFFFSFELDRWKEAHCEIIDF